MYPFLSSPPLRKSTHTNRITQAQAPTRACAQNALRLACCGVAHEPRLACGRVLHEARAARTHARPCRPCPLREAGCETLSSVPSRLRVVVVGPVPGVLVLCVLVFVRSE